MHNYEIYHRNCGKRLRGIREVFNEGRKLSAGQFAHLLNETRDRISNYESGRSQIPIRMVYELYIRGINPVFLISGEGPIFADTEEGNKLMRTIEAKAKIDKEAHDNYERLKSEINASAYDGADIIKAAAGNIKGIK